MAQDLKKNAERAKAARTKSNWTKNTDVGTAEYEKKKTQAMTAFRQDQIRKSDQFYRSTGAKRNGTDNSKKLVWNTDAQKKYGDNTQQKFAWDSKKPEDLNLAETIAMAHANGAWDSYKSVLEQQIYDPTSRFYNPYFGKKVVQSSKAEEFLRNYFQYDGEFDENFFQQTSDILSFSPQLRDGNTGTGIQSPGAKGSDEEWAAYYWIQLQSDMSKQKAVDEEWNELRGKMSEAYEELSLIHNRKPSYEEVMSQIDMSDYSNLKKIDDSRNLDWGTSAAPVELNKGTWYSQEALAGVYNALTQGMDVSEDRDYFGDAVEYYAQPQSDSASRNILLEMGFDTSDWTDEDYSFALEGAKKAGDYELYAELNYARQTQASKMPSLAEPDYLGPRYGHYYTDEVMDQMYADWKETLQKMTVDGEVQKPQKSDPPEYHIAWAVNEVISKRDETKLIEEQGEALKNYIASYDKSYCLDETEFRQDVEAELEKYPELKDYLEGKTTNADLCRPVFFDAEAKEKTIYQKWNGTEEELVEVDSPAEVPFGYDENTEAQASEKAISAKNEEEQVGDAMTALSESGANISGSQWANTNIKIAPPAVIENEAAADALASLITQSNSATHAEKLGEDLTPDQISSVDPVCKAVYETTGKDGTSPLTLRGVDELCTELGVNRMGGGVTAADGIVRTAIHGLEAFSDAVTRLGDRISGSVQESIFDGEFDINMYNKTYDRLRNYGYTDRDAADAALNTVIYASPGLNGISANTDSDPEVNDAASSLASKVAEADGFAESVVVVGDAMNSFVSSSLADPSDEELLAPTQKLAGDLILGLSEQAEPVHAAATKDFLNDLLHGDITNEDIKEAMLAQGRALPGTTLGMMTNVYDNVQNMDLGVPVAATTDKYDALPAKEKHEADRMFNQSVASLEGGNDVFERIHFYANVGGHADYYKNGRAVPVDYKGRNDFYMYNSAMFGDLDQGELLHWKIQETKANYGKWFTYDEMYWLEEAALSGYILPEAFDRIVKERVNAHTEHEVFASANENAIAENTQQARERLEANKASAATIDEARAASYNEQDAHYVNKALASINEGNDIRLSVMNSGAADVIGLTDLEKQYEPGSAEYNEAVMHALNSYAESEGAQLMSNDKASDLGYTTEQILEVEKLLDLHETLGVNSYDVLSSISSDDLKKLGVDLKGVGLNKSAMDVMNEITDYTWYENYQRDGMDLIDNMETAAFDAYMGLGNIATHSSVWVRDGLAHFGVGEKYVAGDGTWQDDVLQFDRATDERYDAQAKDTDRLIGLVMSEALVNRGTGVLGALLAKASKSAGLVRGLNKLDDAADMIKGGSGIIEGVDTIVDLAQTNKLYSMIARTPFAIRSFGGGYMMNRGDRTFASATLRSLLDMGIELFTETDTAERWLEAMDVTKLVAGASDDALFYAARVIKDVKQEVGQELMSAAFGRILDAVEARDIKAIYEGLGEEAKETVVTTTLITLLGAAMDAPVSVVSGYQAKKYSANQSSMTLEEIEELITDFGIDMSGDTKIDEPAVKQPSVRAAEAMTQYRAGEIDEETAKSEIEAALSESESAPGSTVAEDTKPEKAEPSGEKDTAESESEATPAEQPVVDVSKGAKRVLDYQATADQGRADAVGQQAANAVIEEGMSNDPGVASAQEAVAVAQEEVAKIEQEVDSLNTERGNVVQRFMKMLDAAYTESGNLISSTVQKVTAELQQKRFAIESNIQKKSAELNEARNKLAKAEEKSNEATSKAAAIYEAEAAKTKADISQRYIAAKAYMEESVPGEDNGFNLTPEEATLAKKETYSEQRPDAGLSELDMSNVDTSSSAHSGIAPDVYENKYKESKKALDEAMARSKQGSDFKSTIVNPSGDNRVVNKKTDDAAPKKRTEIDPSLSDHDVWEGKHGGQDTLSADFYSDLSNSHYFYRNEEEREFSGSTTADRDDSKSEFFKVPENVEAIDEEFGIVGSGTVFRKLWSQIGNNSKVNVPVKTFNKLFGLAKRVFSGNNEMIGSIFRSSVYSEANADDRARGHAAYKDTAEYSESKMKRVTDPNTGESQRYIKSLETLKALGFAPWRESDTHVALRNTRIKTAGYMYSDQKAVEYDNFMIDAEVAEKTGEKVRVSRNESAEVSEVHVDNYDRWADEFPNLPEAGEYVRLREERRSLHREYRDLESMLKEARALVNKYRDSNDASGYEEAVRYRNEIKRNALAHKEAYDNTSKALIQAQNDFKQAVFKTTRTQRHAYTVISKDALLSWYNDKLAEGSRVAEADQEDIKGKYLEKLYVENHDWEEIFDMYEADLKELGFESSTLAKNKKSKKMVKVSILNDEGEKILNRLYNLYGSGASSQEVLEEYLKERYKIIQDRTVRTFENDIYMKHYDTLEELDAHIKTDEENGVSWAKLGTQKAYFVDPAFLALANYMRSQLTNLNGKDKTGWDSIDAEEMLDLGSSSGFSSFEGWTAFVEEYSKQNNFNKDERNALLYMLTQTENGSKRFGYSFNSKDSESDVVSYSDVVKVSRDGTHSMYMPSYSFKNTNDWKNKNILNANGELDISRAKTLVTKAYSYIKDQVGKVAQPLYKITVSMYDENGVLRQREVGEFYQGEKKGSRYMPTLNEILEKGAVIRLEEYGYSKGKNRYTNTDFCLENDALTNVTHDYVDDSLRKAKAAFNKLVGNKNIRNIKGTHFVSYMSAHLKAQADKIRKDIRNTIADYRANNDKWGEEHTVAQADELKVMRQQLAALDEILKSENFDSMMQEVFSDYQSRRDATFEASDNRSVRSTVDAMLRDFSYESNDPDVQAANELISTDENTVVEEEDPHDTEYLEDETNAYKEKTADVKHKLKAGEYKSVDDVIADMVELDSHAFASNYNSMDKVHRDLQLKLDELMLEGQPPMVRGKWYYDRARSLTGKANRQLRTEYNKRLGDVLNELGASKLKNSEVAEDSATSEAPVMETPVQNTEVENTQPSEHSEAAEATEEAQPEAPVEEKQPEYDVYSKLPSSYTFEESEQHIINQEAEVRRLNTEIKSITKQMKTSYEKGFGKAYDERQKRMNEIRNQRSEYSANTPEYAALDKEFNELRLAHNEDTQGKIDFERYERLREEQKAIIEKRDQLKAIKTENQGIHFGSRSALDAYTGRAKYELYKSIPGTNDLSPRKAAQKLKDNLFSIRKPAFGDITVYSAKELGEAISPLFNKEFFSKQSALASSVRKAISSIAKENADLEFENVVLGFAKNNGKVTIDDIAEAKKVHAQAYESLVRLRGSTKADVADYDMAIAEARKKADAKADAIFEEYRSRGMSNATEKELLKRSDEIGNVTTGKIAQNNQTLSRMRMNAKALSALGNGDFTGILEGRYGGSYPTVLMDVVLGIVMDVTEGKNGKVRQNLINIIQNSDISDDDMEIVLEYFDNDRDSEWLKERTGFDGENVEQSDFKRISEIISKVRSENETYANKNSNPQKFIAKVFGSSERMVDAFFGEYAPIINGLYVQPMLRADDAAHAEQGDLLKDMDKHIPNKNIKVKIDGESKTESLSAVVHRIIEDRPRRKDISEDYDYLITRLNELGIKDKKLRDEVLDAVDWTRSYFHNMLERENESRYANGLPLIPVRGMGWYVPTLKTDKSLLGKLGLNLNMDEIPGHLLGKTGDFTPVAQFDTTHLQRNDGETDYDVKQSIRNTIGANLNTVYQLSNTIRLRQLADAFQGNPEIDDSGEYMYEGEGSNKRLKYDHAVFGVDENGHFYAGNRAAAFAELFNSLANRSANKKGGMIARDVESKAGRIVYPATNLIKGIRALNKIGFNIKPMLTNLQPVIQMATENPVDTLMAIANTIKCLDKNHKDFVSENSNFIAGRSAYSPEETTLFGHANSAAFKPMMLTDQFAANVVVRASMYHAMRRANIQNDPALALQQAEDRARRLMTTKTRASRSAFYDDAILSTVAQFTSESVNALFYFKDATKYSGGIPRYVMKAMALLVAYSMYNYFTGSESLMDPAGAAVKAWNGAKESDSTGDKAAKATLAAMSSLVPFEVDMETETKSAQDVISAIVDTATGESEEGELLDAFGQLGLAMLSEVIPAWEGGKRLYNAIDSFEKGYAETASGTIKHPVEKGNIGDFLISATLGSNATKRGRKYSYGGYKGLTDSLADDYRESVDKYGEDSVSAWERLYDNDSKSLGSRADNLMKTDGVTGEQKQAAIDEAAAERESSGAPADLAPWAGAEYSTSGTAVNIGVELWKKYGLNTYPVKITTNSYSVDGTKYKTYNKKGYELTEDDYAAINETYQRRYNGVVINANNAGGLSSLDDAKALEKRLSKLKTEVIENYIKNKYSVE